MIKLSWPPKELNPNCTGKLRLKMRAQKAYRTEAWLSTLAVLPPAFRAAPETEIPILVTFYPPDCRRRDRDNIIASFKRGQDGIAMAMHADDYWFRPRYQFGEPVNGGSVVVVIGEPETARPIGEIIRPIVANIMQRAAVTMEVEGDD